MESLDGWRALGTFESFGGHRLFVIEGGEPSQPRLLVLHGFPTASFDFAPWWGRLTERFRVLAMDFLGLGLSAKPHPHAYSVLEQADLVEALLASRGVEACHVLAHDYGDTVAQELLARDHARVAPRYLSVALLNGGLFPEAHRPRPVQRLLASPLGPLAARLSSRSRLLAGFSAIFGPDTQPDAALLDAVWRLVTENDGLLVMPALLGYLRERKEQRSRWVGALTRARQPLGIINGGADPVSGVHMVSRFREVVGAGHFIREFPRIGHYPHLEAPEEAWGAYADFMATLP